MNLFFRLLKTILLFYFRPGSIGPGDCSRLSFRVWPNDLDTNGHMNNGRYLTIMDLGRLDLLVRMGGWRATRKRGWYPVLAGTQVRFRRSLTVFQRFEMTTRLAAWDERYVYMEQKITRGGGLITHAYLKGAFVGPAGRAPMGEVVAAMGIEAPSPPMPAALAAWVRSEEEMIREERQERAAEDCVT